VSEWGSEGGREGGNLREGRGEGGSLRELEGVSE
jgi:hypothetical protein